MANQALARKSAAPIINKDVKYGSILMDLSKKKMKNNQISTKISLGGPFNDRDSNKMKD